MWRTGLVAPWHVRSSWIGAQTRVPCIGRQILNHCATREALTRFLSPVSMGQDSGPGSAGPLLRTSQAAIQVLAGAVVSSEAQRPFLNSLVVGRIQFLAALELTVACFFKASRRISLSGKILLKASPD